MDDLVCRESETQRAVLRLRALFEQYGYKKYKMSKFEEYGLYLENKSFLPSGQVITFTDLNGRLLALKPDVTLSIAKNAPDSLSTPEKVYYDENVYRQPRGSNEFREIAQLGLECMGEIDSYCQCEVVLLACKSLELLSGRYVMAISHMGFVSGLLDSCGLSAPVEQKILSLIEHKNAHEIERLCEREGLSAQMSDALSGITTLHGGFEDTLRDAEALVRNDEMSEALSELWALYAALSPYVEKEKLSLDLSVINDLSYYNGLIFQGYIPGAPGAVLSGGRYDNLMERLRKSIGALGFAVYVDELERLFDVYDNFDVDVLLLYDKGTLPGDIVKAVEDLTRQGKSVRAQSGDDSGLSYREKKILAGGGGFSDG